MATSSITKNFVVFGKEQVETFANAIEESFNDKENGKFAKTSVKSHNVNTKEELEKLMRKWIETQSCCK